MPKLCLLAFLATFTVTNFAYGDEKCPVEIGLSAGLVTYAASLNEDQRITAANACMAIVQGGKLQTVEQLKHYMDMALILRKINTFGQVCVAKEVDLICYRGGREVWNGYECGCETPQGTISGTTTSLKSNPHH